MKIFQLIQKPQERGAELFASLLSEELIKRGHEVVLISIFEGNALLPFSGKQIQLRRSLRDRLWDFKGWKEFADLIKREKPDLIQANAGDTLKFSVLSRKMFGWKAPIIFRNASLMSQYISNPWVRRLNSFLLNQVDGIASVSKASQEDMNGVFTFQKPLQQVIPIGILPKVRELKKSDSGRIELVHIGGFTFEKNHFHLLEIFEELYAEDSRFHLTLIGNGPLLESVKEEIVKRRLGDGIVVLGSLQEPFAKVSSNSILLLPSKIEGLPSVILEAMMHRIPVIAYGVGGIPEILKNGETGWCIAPFEKDKFKKAIIEVSCLNSTKKNEIVDNGHNLVFSKYSLESVGKEFEKFYKKLLNQIRLYLN
ncbi:glycosyltransferase family 4 protein [Algoriphagus mannitolivorans]|uniref:glycosyltransferase family 4 protein n=1 Tax=Algoriphagus mannitolivorans TaxID=226504 RepID=UPI00047C0037|nr:glycosyltransferase family 4 protein [Algoriphagus mannitolivorans]